MGVRLRSTFFVELNENQYSAPLATQSVAKGIPTLEREEREVSELIDYRTHAPRGHVSRDAPRHISMPRCTLTSGHRASTIACQRAASARYPSQWL
ncbi:DUF1534 domain-containing protein [Pseudomonas syringae]|uniref:DUF1534 domain-containing protein n=1 Tax=Pseudomonas syringae TaxID=317 RepID=A0A9Q4FKI7_PSESX|nr:DUF1534 domain-containing protein [Pseudomonas syringae]MCF5474342.1 DUF1534 domain-containing protein [Pseudomonas syringae]MCF5484013.1 DUF1534 domain-containing protein [Pseudomonas syringae]MCF5488800.1 DUF1534 domain-containing protein [Pseudomonas syringae]MCF5495907.1 DUF1534 domain-containing protein [Pseudomonas syringae]